MILKTFRINDFQCVRDSGDCETSAITCLVGKNEAGKTALLKALYKLNPIVDTDGTFDVQRDYPRSDVGDYVQETESKAREPAVAVTATFELEASDLAVVTAALGPGALTSAVLVLRKGYANKLVASISLDQMAVMKHLVPTGSLTPDVASATLEAGSLDEAIAALAKAEATDAVKLLRSTLNEVKAAGGFENYVFTKMLQPRLPRFLYFDEYYTMVGFGNIPKLRERQRSKVLHESDHPLVGLLNLARIDLDRVVAASSTQELKNRIEGAGNHVTKKVMEYWSQNRHLQMRFDVREGRPQDPEECRTGLNIWCEIYDQKRLATTAVGARSRGFLWFFSFLSWYSDVKRTNERLILLLDEPGVSLHARAQADLLRYFEKEVHGVHQLVFTTHSPFMVDSKHFERVRIVEDRSLDAETSLPKEEEGTKVVADVLAASRDSVFPLQGALGYEIHQTLFVGPNSLVVEGVSDLIYVQAMSALLLEMSRTGLRDSWTITPVGGADKVPTFVALLGVQGGLRVATLIDIAAKDRQTIENLYKRRLLEKSHVHTYGEYVGSPEADVEDMFEPGFILDVFNEVYRRELEKPVSLADLPHGSPRILVRLQQHLEATGRAASLRLNHYRLAKHFAENLKVLGPRVAPLTLTRFEKAFQALNVLLGN